MAAATAAVATNSKAVTEEDTLNKEDTVGTPSKVVMLVAL